MANNMSKLLDKIERRLGTRQLNLPDYLKKDKWAEVIGQDTLDTFSRYFPNVMTIVIPTDAKRDKDRYYTIDDYIADNIEVLGVKDINWELFTNDSMGTQLNQGYGIYDIFSNNCGLEDAMLLQMRADQMSLFNCNLYVEFKYPNKLKISTTTGADVCRYKVGMPIDILVKHSPNLMTISPTKMETFEALAQADIARFLFSELKYFDGLETVYANIDLKMSDLENEAGKRDDIVNSLKEGYVTASNDNQPIMYTV